jgi:uncharacterized membrane protein
LKNVLVLVKTEVFALMVPANVAPLTMVTFVKAKVRHHFLNLSSLGSVSSNLIYYLLFIIFLVALIVGIFIYTKKIKEENARNVQ